MEENRSDVVEMATESEETPSCLIRPHFDLVIVSTRHKQGLCLVKVNSSDRAIVLFESINECPHTVVP